MRVSKDYYINMIPVSADTYIDHIEACLKRSDKDITEWAEAYRALEARHVELERENAKVRELAKDACTCLRSFFDPEWFDETVFAERMHELGIEV